jgi:hypothetical protein
MLGCLLTYWSCVPPFRSLLLSSGRPVLQEMGHGAADEPDGGEDDDFVQHCCSSFCYGAFVLYIDMNGPLLLLLTHTYTHITWPGPGPGWARGRGRRDLNASNSGFSLRWSLNNALETEGGRHGLTLLAGGGNAGSWVVREGLW